MNRMSFTYEQWRLQEGWMNHKGGRFTADMSEISHHAKDTGKDVHCPGCKAKLKLSDFKERRDDENEVTTWTLKHDCGADMTIFNESTKPTFKQFLLSEAKSTHKDGDMVKPHNFSVKLLSKGKDKKWPALKGEIYEKDVLIGTFSRGAVRDNFIPPIEAKFRTERAKARFDDFADSLSIGETIEALLP
jgi:hypothetical protein